MASRQRRRGGDEAQRARLAEIRRGMAKAKVDALLIRSTDRFLNEYVPPEQSTRIWATGFTGSMGEALVTKEAAYLAVDGRYWLQAREEVTDDWTILEVRLGTGIDQAIADELGRVQAGRRRPLRVGFDPTRLTPSTLARFEASGDRIELVPLAPSPVERARGPVENPRPAGIRAVDEERLGRTVPEKLALVAPLLEAAGADALLVQRLDEIMWLSNLRGTQLPYQATFESVALVTGDQLLLGVPNGAVPAEVAAARPAIRFLPEEELHARLGKKGAKRVGIDFDHNTVAARLAVEASGADVVRMSAPLQPLRSKKTPAELESMKDAFRKADSVVEAVIAWTQGQIQAGERVTEARFAEEVERRFAEAGATGLSFRVIAAAGKNGAHIHYGKPNPRRALKPGELMLLDTGAYFEEGFATDLTRTFLVGGAKLKATEEQKRRYTLVLKGAIAGMKAVLPQGARGMQLDALVRAPIWAAGLDYNHGTGHGVGINVHEFPPRIGPSSLAPLEPGHVFSIEPGLYDPKFGGIRIENLCTMEEGPEPGFMRVVPLTFSPLDRRLIDTKALSTEEKAFLSDFQARHRSRRARRGAQSVGKRQAARRPAR